MSLVTTRILKARASRAACKGSATQVRPCLLALPPPLVLHVGQENDAALDILVGAGGHVAHVLGKDLVDGLTHVVVGADGLRLQQGRQAVG